MLNNIPIEIRHIVYEYLYDFNHEKCLVLKELYSFILKYKTNSLKPSSIKGRYIISYA